MLQCPVCRDPLYAVDRCHACGESFELVGGTPRLISPRSHATVAYNFDSADSVVGDDFYEAFTYPLRPQQAKESPYHLEAAHRHVIEQLPKGARVLEIGCGGGQMRRWTQEQNLTYVGTDISKTRIQEELRVHGGPDFLSDAHFLPFRDGMFDAVYSAALTEHIADTQLMMSEVRRVLKPGGAYLGNVSFLEPWHDNSYFHMSPLGAYRALKRAGFEVRHVWPGVGYSAFTAILNNRLTHSLQHIGKLMARLHGLALMARRWLKHPDPRGGKIAWDATVAGAIDWIAVKPVISAQGRRTVGEDSL
jgi:SAM-dependent methyltransferase